MRFVSLVFLIAFVGATVGDQDFNGIKKAVEKCKEVSGYSEDLAEYFMHGVYEKYEDNKCFIQCVLNDLGWMSGDNLVKDKIVEDVFVTPYNETVYRDITTHCIDDVSTMKLNGCLTATSFDTCAARLTNYYSSNDNFNTEGGRTTRGIFKVIKVSAKLFKAGWKLFNTFHSEN